MTVQEAIKNVTAYVYMECENMPQQVIKALDVLKDSAKECEQYKEFGTPTQILERIGGLDVELGKYHSLGTVEELKEAREKQIASKWICYDISGRCVCPECESEWDYMDNCVEEFKYCPNCGKRLG